jgi:serine/threonine-protein kinase
MLTRLTFEGRNLWPLWGHDGRRVIYASNRVGMTYDVYAKAADGTGREEALLVKPLLQIPHSLSGDGRIAAVGEWGPTEFGVSLYATGDWQPKASFRSGGSGALSPDGRWLAYTSSESGRYEIYVRPTSGEDGKWIVSTEGGREPVWAHSGKELFFRHRDQVLAVDVDTAAGFTPGKPRLLFEKTYAQDDLQLDGTMYEVSPDGQKFLMLQNETEAATGELKVVVNWVDELRGTVKPRLD